MTIKQKIKKFFSDQKWIFKNFHEQISTTNINTLLVGSSLGLIVFIILILITPFIIPTWHPTYHYWILPIILAFSLIIAVIYKKKGHNKFYHVQAMCWVFIVLLAAALINLTVFSYDDTADTFVSLFMMIAPALFIFKFQTIVLFLTSCAIAFVIFTYNFKTGIAAEHDMFAAFATLFFAGIETIVICKIHNQDFIIKNELKKLTEQDTLTVCYNRRAFENQCRQYIKIRPEQELYAIILLDVDNFKQVNDEYGHQYGDEIIKFVAQSIVDCADKNTIVGRVGGDEFCVFFKDVQSYKDAYIKANKILQAINSKYLKDSDKILQTSIGLFTTYDYIEFDKLYKKADSLLYKAKSKGKNQIYEE